MTDDAEPPASKLTRSKQRWAREGKFLTGKITRPDEQRLPPGQHLTADWPVLDLGPKRVVGFKPDIYAKEVPAKARKG